MTALRRSRYLPAFDALAGMIDHQSQRHIIATAGVLASGHATRFHPAMTKAQEMLNASPARLPVRAGELAAGIDACLACVQACTACADSDLIEKDIAALRTCVALNLICADICDATARVLSAPGQWHHATVHDLLVACVSSCGACAEECMRHAAHHRHCAICAEVCRTCGQACTALLDGAAFEAPGPSPET